MTNYIHDEWCDMDGEGKCDCYVSLLKEKDAELDDLHKWIADYRERITTFEEELVHRAEYNSEGQPINWCASVLEHTGLLAKE